MLDGSLGGHSFQTARYKQIQFTNRGDLFPFIRTDRGFEVSRGVATRLKDTTVDTVSKEHVFSIPAYCQPFYTRILDALMSNTSVLELSPHDSEPENVVTWLRRSFYLTFVSPPPHVGEAERNDRDALIIALIKLGFIKSNALGNWEVSRPGDVLAESLGLRSIPEVLNGISEWIKADEVSDPGELPLSDGVPIQKKRLLYFERGAGDGRNVDWLRTQCPDWDFRSIGHVLYYSVTNLLHGFLRPELKNDPDAVMFLRILSIFLLREMEHQFPENTDINLIFPLLASMGDWIRRYVECDQGFYVDSNEFEFDTLKKFGDISQNVLGFFRDLNWVLSAMNYRFDNGLQDLPETERDKILRENKMIFLSVFQKSFRSDFCDEIGRYLFDETDPIRNPKIDLRKILPIYPMGYVQGFFTELPQFLNEGERVSFSGDVRSSSHETNEDLEKDLSKFLELLENGGALSFDGGRESYVRDDRSDILLSIIKRKNAELGREEFRCYAIVEKNAPEGTRAQSLWIQRARKDGRFIEPEKLASWYRDKYEIVPINDYADRFLIRFESGVRRIFKRVFMQRYQDMDRVKQQFGNDEVKDSIARWVDFISDPAIRPTSLSAAEVVNIFSQDIQRSATLCSHSAPQMKEIPGLSSEDFSSPAPRLKPQPTLRQIVR